MAEALKVSVISPEKTVFEGAAEQVVAPGWNGEFGILHGHAPMLVLLGAGDVRIRAGSQDHRFHISGGFLQVVDDNVTILSERAEQG